MTAPREYLDFLQDMADMMRKVEEFTSGVDFDAFVNDAKTVLAVTRAMEIIGEAAKHIPAPVRWRYPAMP